MASFIFATNNKNKVAEIKAILNNRIDVMSLAEANIDIDIPEPHDTLEANAREKSITIYNLTQVNCFSEDTGLEVAVLGGAPGVKSARYAGDDCNAQKNIEKLLSELSNQENRNAQFKTVISLIIKGKEFQFAGTCKGQIINTQRGNDGFGYDSIFIPEGSNKTFAEMSMEEKNMFSHRKKATIQFIQFLNDHYGKS